MSDDLPKGIEEDDERFDELMDLQDPNGIVGFEEEPPKTIEEKYERRITLEKVIQPMLESLFDNLNQGENP